MGSSVTLTFTQLLLLALVPAMLTGIVGVVGSLIGPWLLEDRKQATEKRKRRAEKFEELVSALYEHRHWLDRKESHVAFGLDVEEGPSPQAKAEAICSVYFPEFRERLSALERTVLAYQGWMHRAGQKRVAGTTGYADDLDTVYRPYTQAFHYLLDEMREFARKEFQ